MRRTPPPPPPPPVRHGQKRPAGNPFEAVFGIALGVLAFFILVGGSLSLGWMP